jgi:hypothetical protein
MAPTATIAFSAADEEARRKRAERFGTTQPDKKVKT